MSRAKDLQNLARVQVLRHSSKSMLGVPERAALVAAGHSIVIEDRYATEGAPR